MADTNFTSGTVIASSWLNDINDAIYNGKGFFGKVIRANDPTYGIVGDGVTDDTTALGVLLSEITTGTKVELCGLTIKVSSNTYIQNLSNFEIDGQGATIIAADGMVVSSGKELLSFRNCTDFSVKNLNVNGNRTNRTPVETAAHNIELRSCQRFVFEKVRSINAVVDGFILNTSTNTDASTFVRYGLFLECSANNCYRQGMSIINAYNIVINGGSFDNTNGTSPQSGIDVESNSGAATPGNAFILIQGASFSNNTGPGVITSAVSTGVDIWIDSCYFSANTERAIVASASGTVISKCSFKNHTGGTQGLVTFPSSTPVVTYGVIRDCTFASNTATVPCIYTHSSTSNIQILNNTIVNHTGSGGISLAGQDIRVVGNYVNTSGGTGITAVGTDPLIESNVFVSCLSRAIYSVGSIRPTIIRNTCRDVASVSGAYIQCDDAEAILDYNTCISSSAATTTFGLRVTNVTARSVSFNTFINLHSTDPITFTGVGRARVYVGNTGGTTNVGGMGEVENLRATQASVGKASTTTIGGTTATTVGAAGAASALPANPLGYIIGHVGTTQVKIPYYNN